MKNFANLRTLLVERGNKGVTVQDFPKGFRLSARIYDLRFDGWLIDTAEIKPCARYVYKGHLYMG